MKIIATIFPTDLVTNLLLSSFCHFLQTKNKSLVFRNISVFYLQRVALYFKAMPNSIDFCKGIFLRVIRVRIIVPCCNRGNESFC